VHAVAVEVAAGAVVVLGGAGIGVPGEDLGVAERDAGVESGQPRVFRTEDLQLSYAATWLLM
jgi:hypothetical protein